MDQNTKLAVIMLSITGVVLLVLMLLPKCSTDDCESQKWSKTLQSMLGYTIASTTPGLPMKCKGADGKPDDIKVQKTAECVVDNISQKYTPDEAFADGPLSPFNDTKKFMELIDMCASKAQCPGN